jgi:beta-lactamase superfamily II metal-dependent hydrolase
MAYMRRFLLVLLLLISPPPAASPAMQSHYIDVGQGGSTLLEFPCDAFLIDSGGQDAEHVEHLDKYVTDFFHRSPGLYDTLNTLFITHPHIDHTRCISLCKSRIVFRGITIVTGFYDCTLKTTGWIGSDQHENAAGPKDFCAA